ncbi:CATRA system-associated protein [Cryptosporangium phraense]|uniref:GNAT family N-acetyltransferase n=1 Tax=Cryptosporangium phraense TaxID=2593070 RepID=A0A545APD8_9ACTN|nr:CATRA system-associated protein [Cryptosporangium phraense]TQS43153.1 GNAT family N-acetyltransferase [Cryptosporangium phraense]
MTYQVRRIEPNDFRELKRLRLEALKNSPLAFVEQYDDAVVLPDSAWRDRASTQIGFAAVAGGRFVGMAGVFREAEVIHHVSAMLVGVYVTPAFRGGAYGTAQAVTAAAVTFAFEHLHADVVRLFVLDLNERAKAFYRRAGFTETGHTIRYPPDPAYLEREMALTERMPPEQPSSHLEPQSDSLATVRSMEQVDEETIDDALDVLEYLSEWRLAPQRWESVQAILDRMDIALRTADGPALRRAVAELELSGPVRANRIGTAEIITAPSRIVDRQNTLVHVLTVNKGRKNGDAEPLSS